MPRSQFPLEPLQPSPPPPLFVSFFTAPCRSTADNSDQSKSIVAFYVIWALKTPVYWASYEFYSGPELLKQLQTELPAGTWQKAIFKANNLWNCTMLDGEVIYFSRILQKYIPNITGIEAMPSLVPHDFKKGAMEVTFNSSQRWVTLHSCLAWFVNIK